MRTGKKLVFDNLWKYILAAAVVVFFWTGVYENASQINGNQRVTIAVYNMDCDTQRLRNALWTKLPELTQQEVLELYVDDLKHIPNQTYAVDILTAQILRSDMVIMPESLLNALDLPIYFPSVPKTLQGENGYFFEGIQYGIRIPSSSYFASYYIGNEPCYLLFNSNSVNLGGLYEKGEAEDDAAIRIFEYLLKEVAQ